MATRVAELVGKAAEKESPLGWRISQTPFAPAQSDNLKQRERIIGALRAPGPAGNYVAGVLQRARQPN